MTTARPTTPAAIQPSALLVPTPYRVEAKVAQLDNTATLFLAPIEGDLPSFEPAQVSMLGAFGVGEAAISISHGADTTHGYTIHRAGAITNALVDTPVGGVVTVRGPFGRPWPLGDVAGRDLLFVAGGLGLAPLRAAIEIAAAHLAGDQRIALVYGAKRPDQMLFGADLDSWADHGVQVRTTVDDIGTDQTWQGSVGVAPALLGGDGVQLDWAHTASFVCGPDVMMHFTARRLLELGVPADQIWLSVERNMQCGNALCGHCQLGPFIVCRDGPVVTYAEIGTFHQVPQL